jgi:hypothetical protein
MNTWDTLAKRVAWVQETRKLSRRAWCAKANIGASTLSQALLRESKSGKGNLDSDIAFALGKAAGVDPVWLNTGEGSPDPETRAAELHMLDAKRYSNAAAYMLADLDGVAIKDALFLVHDVETTVPSVEPYYRAARRKLLTPDAEKRLHSEAQSHFPGGSRLTGKKRN